MSKSIGDLKKISSQVRRDILRMVHNVQSGHPGGSLGCTDLLVSLFFNIMKRKQKFDMNGKDEDIFFLSNGHISPVFYSVLSRSCLLYTSPSPRDRTRSRMPSSA